MKIKTNEEKEHYNLWFILEGRAAFFRHDASVTCSETKKWKQQGKYTQFLLMFH